MIGCHCSVCTSSDPKNSRNRPCVLITTDQGGTILVDTPPELRLMVTRHKIDHVNAVLYTHSHADHLFGLDDLRAYNYLQEGAIPLYAEENVLEDIRRAYAYCFVGRLPGGGTPQLALHEIAPGKDLMLGGARVLPLRVMHGRLPILAFKFGERAAYVTDVTQIPERAWGELEGLDVLLLDAVRREPHPMHFHLDKALEVIAQLAPRRAYLVHLSHDYDYDQTNATLPEGVALAYDGLEIEVAS